MQVETRLGVQDKGLWMENLISEYDSYKNLNIVWNEKGESCW